jgi:hypothetical protein
MSQPSVDDRVRLTHDVPQFSLPRGAVGVVRSIWFAPSVAFEVEFHQLNSDSPSGCRCLLRPEQVEMVDDGDERASGDSEFHDEESMVAGVL